MIKVLFLGENAKNQQNLWKANPKQLLILKKITIHASKVGYVNFYPKFFLLSVFSI